MCAHSNTRPSDAEAGRGAEETTDAARGSLAAIEAAAREAQLGELELHRRDDARGCGPNVLAGLLVAAGVALLGVSAAGVADTVVPVLGVLGIVAGVLIIALARRTSRSMKEFLALCAVAVVVGGPGFLAASLDDNATASLVVALGMGVALIAGGVYVNRRAKATDPAAGSLSLFTHGLVCVTPQLDGGRPVVFRWDDTTLEEAVTPAGNALHHTVTCSRRDGVWVRPTFVPTRRVDARMLRRIQQEMAARQVGPLVERIRAGQTVTLGGCLVGSAAGLAAPTAPDGSGDPIPWREILFAFRNGWFVVTGKRGRRLEVPAEEVRDIGVLQGVIDALRDGKGAPAGPAAAAGAAGAAAPPSAGTPPATGTPGPDAPSAGTATPGPGAPAPDGPAVPPRGTPPPDAPSASAAAPPGAPPALGAAHATATATLAVATAAATAPPAAPADPAPATATATATAPPAAPAAPAQAPAPATADASVPAPTDVPAPRPATWAPPAPAPAAPAAPPYGPPSAGPGRPGRTRRVAFLAVAVVLVLGLLAVLLVRDAGDDPETSASPTDGTGAPAPEPEAAARDGQRLDLVFAARPVIEALDREATASYLSVARVERVPGGATDVELARSTTDDAVASFEEVATDAGQLGDAYDPARSALATLDSLRGRVDQAAAGSGGDREAEAAVVDDGYRSLLLDLVDGASTIADDVEAPTLRTGAGLYATALRQEQIVEQLLTRLSQAARAGGRLDDTDVGSTVRQLWNDYEAGLARILDEAPGTDFEEAAARLDEDLERSGFLAPVPEILAGAPIDVARLVGSTTGDGGSAWPVFVDAVRTLLVALAPPGD